MKNIRPHHWYAISIVIAGVFIASSYALVRIKEQNLRAKERSRQVISERILTSENEKKRAKLDECLKKAEGVFTPEKIQQMIVQDFAATGGKSSDFLKQISSNVSKDKEICLVLYK